MFKMHYFSNKFSNFVLKSLDFAYLKLGDLTKLCFFKLIMTNQTLKYQLWRNFSDVIVIMSPKNVT